MPNVTANCVRRDRAECRIHGKGAFSLRGSTLRSAVGVSDEPSLARRYLTPPPRAAARAHGGHRGARQEVDVDRVAQCRLLAEEPVRGARLGLDLRGSKTSTLRPLPLDRLGRRLPGVRREARLARAPSARRRRCTGGAVRRRGSPCRSSRLVTTARRRGSVSCSAGPRRRRDGRGRRRGSAPAR